MYIKRRIVTAETRRRRRCFFSVPKNRTMSTTIRVPGDNYRNMSYDPFAELTNVELRPLKNKFMESLKPTPNTPNTVI